MAFIKNKQRLDTSKQSKHQCIPGNKLFLYPLSLVLIYKTIEDKN